MTLLARVIQCGGVDSTLLDMGGWYIAVQPHLCEGTLVGPRKAIFRSVSWDTHQVTQKVLYA